MVVLGVVVVEAGPRGEELPAVAAPPTTGFADQYVRTSVADPDPGSGAFLTLGTGIRKKLGSGSGMNNTDHIYESSETIFWG
jgi:hypothetical protein